MSDLVVPDDERWMDVFGVEPRTEQSSGDDFVREVLVPLGHDGQLRVTWDATDSSFRLRHERDGVSALDFYREVVTEISIERRQAARWLVVEYGHLGLVGRLLFRIDERYARPTLPHAACCARAAQPMRPRCRAFLRRRSWAGLRSAAGCEFSVPDLTRRAS